MIKYFGEMKNTFIVSVLIFLLTTLMSCEDKINDQRVDIRIQNQTDHFIDSIIVSSKSSSNIKFENIASDDLSEYSHAMNLSSDLSFKTYFNNTIIQSDWSVPSDIIPDVENYSKCPEGEYTFSVQDYNGNSSEVIVVLLEYTLYWSD